MRWKIAGIPITSMKNPELFCINNVFYSALLTFTIFNSCLSILSKERWTKQSDIANRRKTEVDHAIRAIPPVVEAFALSLIT